MRTSGIFLIGSFASLLRTYCFGLTTDRIKLKTKKLLFESFLKQDVDYIRNYSKGELLTLFDHDVHLTSTIVTDKLAAGSSI
jgi:ABC-type bacteriocin/lantibiotic exporter with double-glycine peptidase domain